MSDPQVITNTNTAALKALDVTDDDGIARVWTAHSPAGRCVERAAI